MNMKLLKYSLTKGKVWTGVGALVAAAGAFEARASVLALDDFSYATTGTSELNSANGGSGWSGAWSATTVHSEVLSPGLSYLPSLVDVGNRAQVDPRNAETSLSGSLVSPLPSIASRSLSASASGDSLFVSFLIRQAGGIVSNGDEGFLWLGTSSGTGNAADTAARIGFLGGTVNDLAVSLSTGAAFNTSTAGGQATTLTTYLLVAKLSKTLGGASNPYNRVDLWVNPTVDYGFFQNPLNISATATTAGGISSVAKVGLGLVNYDSTDLLDFDRIRLGTTIEDVLPVFPPLATIPEAGTSTAVGGLLLAGGVFYLRRRLGNSAAS